MRLTWRLIRMSIKEEWGKKHRVFFDRLIAVLTTVVFLSLWIRLTEHGPVAGFTQAEFVTYALLVHIVRPLVFLFKYRVMANEIMNGGFSLVLTLPVAVGWYYYARSWGERFFGLLCGLGEVVFLQWVFDARLVWPDSGTTIFLFVIMLLVAHILSEILAFLLSSVAFWTGEANSPRFLYDWIAEFMAGLYFPLWLLSPLTFAIIASFPFIYFLYQPLLIWIHPTGLGWTMWCALLVWMSLGIGFTLWIYRRGLRHYDAPGI